MRTKYIVAAALVGVTALALVGGASANRHQRQFPRGIRYTFVGQLTSVPSNGGVSINVVGGNRVALREMLGAPVTQTFAYGPSTEFLKWSKGVPTVVQPDQLAAGDYVRVNIRARPWSSLADLEAKAASLVGDDGAQLFRPALKLYLFRGTIASVGATSVTVNITGGDRAAMRLLVAQPAQQTFTTGRETIFLLWQGKVPTVISSSQLKVGARVVVRDRATKHSTLARLEASAARHVAEHDAPTP